ncbi:MAG: hypothetical protein JST54_04035 [Deltaproteobacteria bacterium]|nr:hypothetical protein [Deltaproteobacteria bacterium]
MSGSNKLKFGNLTLGQFYDSAYQAANANLPAGAKLKILGKQMSKSQLLAELAKRKQRYDDADRARTQLRELVAARQQAEPEAQAFADGYAAAIKAEFGTSPTIDEKFGVPRKQPRRQRSVQEKVQASAKASATRGLRHTMGPRQKEGLKASGSFKVSVNGPPGGGDSSGPSSSTGSPPPRVAAPASVISAAPVPAATPVVSTPAHPAPSASSDDAGAVPNGSSGSVAPMRMNGSGH